MTTRSRVLLAASLATAMAAPMMAADTMAAAKSGETVHCYGVNKCKGVGDCKTATNSCKGHNSCAHQAFIEMDKDLCLRLDGGSLTAPEKKK